MPEVDYEVEVEITTFNLRVRAEGSDKKTFEVAVNCVVSDHGVAVVKGLCPDVKFTHAHRIALARKIKSMGFSYDWKSKRRDFNMNKEKIAHPSEAQSDADHFAAAKHALEQIGHGHYGAKDVSVSQEDLGNGEVRITASFVRFETDTSTPAAERK